MKKDIFNNSCENFEIDHIYPLAKGGSNFKENKQNLCQTSNREKADKTKGKINGIQFSIIHKGKDVNNKIIGKMKISK